MKPHLLILAGFLLIQTSLCCIVTLRSGIIEGRLAVSPKNNKTFCAFQQIPYAAPPIGALRFQPPQPVARWNNILETKNNTKICNQIFLHSNSETEDCLYLNVYTPELLSTVLLNSLSVMVFIHGGGFIIGDGTHQSFGPEFLIAEDVIVVAFNYRLGAFGFLSTQDEAIRGNYGLKDQLFALQWVKNNIHLFGGDSTKVTVVGQSAGASSVGYHLINKKSEGLFRAGILESSCALSAYGFQRNARSYTYQTASYINSSVTEESTSEEVLNVMLQASAEEIKAAADFVESGETYDNLQLLQGYFYAPVIEPESDEAFITEKMFEVISRGGANRVPIMIGTNSEEALSQSMNLGYLSWLMAQFDNNVSALVPNDMNTVSNVTRTAAGERIRELYSGNGLLQNNPAAGLNYLSDGMFTRSVIMHAFLQSAFSDVYFYVFAYDGLMGNISVVIEGADRVGHAEELGYLWRINSGMFDNFDLSIFPQSDITTQDRLLKIWTDFAKTLNPTPEKVDLLQHIIWPRVLPDNHFPYLNIGENLTIKNYPKEIRFNGWRAIYNEFGVRPWDTY